MEELSHEPQTPSQNEATQWGVNKLDLSRVQNAAAAIRRELAKVVVGQSELVELLTVTVFCEGHVLLEGVPGIAKTLSAKLLAKP